MKTLKNAKGEWDVSKVFAKMAELYFAHLAAKTEHSLSLHFAQEFGENKIGFDLSEAWKIGFDAYAKHAQK